MRSGETASRDQKKEKPQTAIGLGMSRLIPPATTIPPRFRGGKRVQLYGPVFWLSDRPNRRAFPGGRPSGFVRFSYPITAAGPLLFHTGFPIIPRKGNPQSFLRVQFYSSLARRVKSKRRVSVTLHLFGATKVRVALVACQVLRNAGSYAAGN